MCDIYKYDEDNYQVDGDMYSADDFAQVNAWHQVIELLGSEKSNLMRECGFKPAEIVKFMDRIAREAA